MWYVYILKSQLKPFLYVGSTNNLKRRLSEHNDGKTKSTAPYTPLELISFIAVSSEINARKLEKYLKAGSVKTILKKRILNDEGLAKYEVLSEA